MKFQLLTYFATLPLLFGINQAYWLDVDCRNEVGEVLDAGLKAVFDRYELARDELEKVTSGNNFNEHVKDLALLLYQEGDLKGVLEDLKSTVSVRMSISSNPNSISELLISEVPLNEVVFQCSGSKNAFDYRPVEDGKGNTVQKYINLELYYVANENIVKKCFEEKTTEAFTVRKNKDLPSIIQLCPWFYEEELIEDEEKLEDFKNDRSGEKGNLAKTSQEEIEGLKESGLVVADLVHDFLFVVAHEIAHTEAGGLAEDSIDVEGTKPDNPDDAYHWLNCVKYRNPVSAEGRAFFVTMVNEIIYSGLKPTAEGLMKEISGWQPPN